VSFIDLLNLTASVQNSTPTIDDVGAETRAWAEVGTVSCRVRALSGTERAMSGQRGVQVSHRIYCVKPAGFSITEDHRLVVSGITYEVGYVNDVDRLGRHLEIDCLEMRREA
jgi:SPP1 family predicted phage head-tail adaptor